MLLCHTLHFFILCIILKIIIVIVIFNIVFQPFYNFYFFNNFYFFGHTMCMWDLSSPIRDQTCTPCTGSAVLTTGLPGKSLFFNFYTRDKSVLHTNTTVLGYSEFDCIFLFISEFYTCICFHLIITLSFQLEEFPLAFLVSQV